MDFIATCEGDAIHGLENHGDRFFWQLASFIEKQVMDFGIPFLGNGFCFVCKGLALRGFAHIERDAELGGFLRLGPWCAQQATCETRLWTRRWV